MAAVFTKIGKINVFLFLFTLLLFQYQPVSAQVGGVDVKSVKVDDLSDEQILGYIRQAEEKGLNQAQLEALAIQRGVSQSEISKLRRRIRELKSGKGNNIKSTSSISGKRSPKKLDQKETFGSLPGDAPTKPEEGEGYIFGLDLFRKKNLSFAPNLSLPTPTDYELGPGDELIIDLWGDIQEFYRLEISFEGTVRPEGHSPIYVNGLSMKQATKKIIDRLSQKNSGLKPRDGKAPTIFHQVSLGNIRTINIEVIGDVVKPSLYALPSLATIYTALHAAGGPSDAGTFRDIRLIRNNKLIESIDVYSFLTDGIRSGDLRLRNGDVIIVKPFKRRVKLRGAVKRQGLFELKEGESFNDLLNYAGGFLSTAYKSNILVKRNGESERHMLNVDNEDFKAFTLENGDIIDVGKILNRFTNRVFIKGAVLREGQYQLTDGLTIKQLIDKAGGVSGDAFMNRATIYRSNEDYSQTTIPVDLKALLDGSISDVPLLKEDVVRVSSIYDLKEEYHVGIEGDIIDVGVYPFFNQMTVQDLIILSGGLRESASGSIIEIARRNKNGSINSTAEILTLSIDENLSLKNEDRNLLLEPFDQVYVRRAPGYTAQQLVTVEGEVLAPGLYTISRKDERVSEIIKRAKGLSPYAYPKGAILVRKTEFSSLRSSDEISQTLLALLREKVMGDDSELQSISQKKLIERLDKIESEISLYSESDRVGSEVRQDLIQDVSDRDSLINDVIIRDQEPVALDLEKILNEPGSKYDFIVRPGDVISIPGQLETVRVAGEVTSPLNVRYDKSFSFKDYIYQSGGFLARAKKGRSYVQYPNGERKGVKRFLWFKKYPKVEPGSTIFVSRKPKKSKTSIQEVLAIASSLTTLVFLVDRLRN